MDGRDLNTVAVMLEIWQTKISLFAALSFKNVKVTYIKHLIQ